MKKGDRVTLNQLTTGDRFFIASDKNRIVWELTVVKPIKSGFNWTYGAQTDAMKIPKYFAGTLQVVFLRSKN